MFVEGNKVLVEILVQNLFTNAIRHSPVGGDLSISLDAHKMEFVNTGASPEIVPANSILSFTVYSVTFTKGNAVLFSASFKRPEIVTFTPCALTERANKTRRQ